MLLKHREVVKKRASKDYFFPFLLLKVIAGILLGLIYTYYYKAGGDTILMATDAIRLAKSATVDFRAYLDTLLWGAYDPEFFFIGEYRTFFFVRILSVISWFSFHNYWLIGVWLSIFSAWSLYQLASKIQCLWKVPSTTFLLFIVLLPSFTIWSSGVVKETYAIAGLAQLLALLIDFRSHQRIHWVRFICVAVMSYHVFMIKYYYLLPIVLFFGPYAIIKWWGDYLFFIKRNLILRYLLIFGLIIIIGSEIHPNLSLEGFQKAAVASNELTFQQTPHYNRVYFLEWSSVQNVVINTMRSIKAGVFRPYLWESRGMLGTLQAIENFVLLLSTIFALYMSVKKKWKLPGIVWVVLAFLLFMITLLPYTTPSLGSLSRYRVSYIPFYALLLAIALTKVNFSKKRVA